MKAILVCALVVLLSGCAANRGSMSAQVAWQAMNVVDMGQTVHIARSKRTDKQMAAWFNQGMTANRYCFEEVNPLTRALIGKHPSEAEVIGSSLLWAAGHALVSRWLDRRTDAAFASDSPNRGAWYVGRIAFHGVMLGSKAWQIGHNNSIGLKPFGQGCKR